MNVKIQSVHFDADEKLMDYVSRKVDKLKTYHDKIVKIDVFLKLDNVVHNITLYNIRQQYIEYNTIKQNISQHNITHHNITQHNIT